MTPYKKYETAKETIMHMNAEDLTEEERFALGVAVGELESAMAECADLEREFTIGSELGALSHGKQLRDYCKQHKAELKRYGFKISLEEKYPLLPLIVSAIALLVPLIALLLRICL